MRNCIIIHHTDLDGIGVRLIATQEALNRKLKPIPHKCGYSNVNQTVRGLIRDTDLMEKTDLFIIADISITMETARVLNDASNTYNFELVLVDHHKSAEYLNVFPWAEVSETVVGIPRCATWQLAVKLNHHIKFGAFIELVDQWDTWKWKKTNNSNAKSLNELFLLYGGDRFMQYLAKIYWTQDVVETEDLFPAEVLDDLDMFQRFIEKQAKTSLKGLKKTSLTFKGKTYKAGLVFLSSEVSLVADYIFENLNKPVDVLIFFNFPNVISLRTQRGTDIDLPALAKELTGQGGGHPNSAGSILSNNLFNKGFKRFLNRINPKIFNSHVH